MLGTLMIVYIYVIVININKGRKLIAVFDGVVISAEDNIIRMGNGTFSYTDINQIVIDNDFIVIKIGKISIPILVVDECREDVITLVELIKNKGVYYG